MRIAVLAAIVGLVCVLAPLSRSQPPKALPQERSRQTSMASANFAVADFDGDRKPDLATVEMERGLSRSDARYSIRFKLATGDTHVVGVTAPTGGLQIVARDVNGDRALDLLVSTAWQHEQVAVLLNDGHGNFTLARPESFSASFGEFENQWESEPLPRGESAVVVRHQSSAPGEPEQCRSVRAQRQTGQATPAPTGKRFPIFLFSLLGRAPPAGILQA